MNTDDINNERRHGPGVAIINFIEHARGTVGTDGLSDKRWRERNNLTGRFILAVLAAKDMRPSGDLEPALKLLVRQFGYDPKTQGAIVDKVTEFAGVNGPEARKTIDAAISCVDAKSQKTTRSRAESLRAFSARLRTLQQGLS
jgi:hypothetical protein